VYTILFSNLSSHIFEESYALCREPVRMRVIGRGIILILFYQSTLYEFSGCFAAFFFVKISEWNYTFEPLPGACAGLNYLKNL